MEFVLLIDIILNLLKSMLRVCFHLEIVPTILSLRTYIFDVKIATLLAIHDYFENGTGVVTFCLD